MPRPATRPPPPSRSDPANAPRTAGHARRRRGADEADGCTESREPQPVSDDEAPHVRSRRTERDTDADLRVALTYRGAHQRVQPDRRQQPRRHAEDADQERIEARTGEGAFEQLREA